MENTNPDVREQQRPRRRLLTNGRIQLLIAVAFLLGSCSSSNSGCSSCQQGCNNAVGSILAVIKQLIAPQCERFCTLKVQLYDGATGTNISGVQPGSNLDFDLIVGGVTYFSGVQTVNADGTMLIPLNPCMNLTNGSLNNVQSISVLPYGGSLKSTNGCPAGNCRPWTMGPGSNFSFQGMEGCTPVVRLPLTTARACRPC